MRKKSAMLTRFNAHLYEIPCTNNAHNSTMSPRVERILLIIASHLVGEGGYNNFPCTD